MAVIRDYTRDDDDAIVSVWEAASQIAHPFLSEDFIAGERVAIREQYLPNTTTQVAEENGTVIGFASMMGSELGAIFLDPAYHGKGVGRALMDHAARGHAVVDVEVFEENPIGRAFYQRYGFREVSKSTHEATGETLIRMQWRADQRQSN